MKRSNLISHIKRHGAVLARNRRRLDDIYSMAEFVKLYAISGKLKPEYYELEGYIFGKPVFRKLGMKEIKEIAKL